MTIRRSPVSGKRLFHTSSTEASKARGRTGLGAPAALVCAALAAGFPALAGDEAGDDRGMTPSTTHAIAMHGQPAMAPGFEALPYVDPDAPKGGRARFGEVGGFDSLNPFTLRGDAPWAMTAHVYETLLARSYDEPFTLYASLAESVETPPDRSSVSFTLDARARFSDGSPVTVEDVVWSLETLGEEGHPRYRPAWEAVVSVRATGERRVTVTFDAPNRELPLLIALRPILKKAEPWASALDSSPMTPPVGSGPYVVESAEPGRRVVFARDPDWWGAGLAINRGLNNFDAVVYDYYRSADVLWQAVEAGEVDLFADPDPVRWARGYDFPAVREGRLARSTIANARPSGMEGFVFNTRRAPLDDRRVRRALGLAFDWAWVNRRLYDGQYARMASYFAGSPLAFEGAAEGRERALLAPFVDTLPEGTLDGRAVWPETAGTGRDRAALREAARLLDAAGLGVEDGARRRPDGRALVLTVLVRDSEHATLATLWAEALEPLGVALDIRRVDGAQFAERKRGYDYDVVVNRWALSLSPGTEQRYYFGSEGRETPGTRNYAGIAEPAVDAAIEALLAAEGEAAFRASVRALDRVLTAGLYVVPFGYLPEDRIAHGAAFAHPERPSLYGWWGWWSGPGTWWVGR
ncbi:MAG: extracellular solute-binding protein [Paracoccaceae bacterium]